MKPCPFCAEPIQDQAIKCRFCGSMLDGSAAPATATAPPAPGPAVAPLRMIFEGAPSWKSWFWSYVLMLLVALGMAGVGWAGLLGLVPWRFALPGLGVLALGDLIGLASLELLRRSIRYRVSSRNLDTERGILSKQIETLQLWRVRDLEFRQSLTDRLLGIARIHVHTRDVSDPELVLHGLPGSRAIFDQLKEAAELARQQRVIGVVD